MPACAGGRRRRSRGAVAAVPTAQADRECCQMRAGMGARMDQHLGGVHAFNDAPHLSTAATFCLIGSPTWWELSAA